MSNVPKYLSSHPAIAEVEDMREQSDYKWGIWLKEGWCFNSGRAMGCRSLNIMNKADLDIANPIPEGEYDGVLNP